MFEAAECGEIKRDGPSPPVPAPGHGRSGGTRTWSRARSPARRSAAHAAKGGYVGGKRLHRRYGYELIDGQYVPIEDEQRAISMILGYRNASPGPISWAGIASFLNMQEIPSPSGTEWYPATCMRIASANRRRGSDRRVGGLVHAGLHFDPRREQTDAHALAHVLEAVVRLAQSRPLFLRNVGVLSALSQ